MKKLVAVALVGVLSLGVMAGCSSTSSTSDNNSGSTTTTAETSGDVAMQYMSPDDLKSKLDDSSVVIVDVRKAEDYKTSHIKGAINADMDKAKEGDAEAGVSAMEAALEEAVGDKTGGDKTLVLVCYSGKSYAQAGTNALNTIGAKMANVYTLEGGMKAWGEDDLES